MARNVNITNLNNIGMLRIRAGLTRVQVATECNISTQFISQFEKKKPTRKPSSELAQKLCVLYGCTMNAIFPIKKIKKI